MDRHLASLNYQNLTILNQHQSIHTVELNHKISHEYLHGFDDPNFYDKDSKERKQQIEDFDPNNLQFIQVTIGSNPLQEKINDQLNKMIEDS